MPLSISRFAKLVRALKSVYRYSGIALFKKLSLIFFILSMG